MGKCHWSTLVSERELTVCAKAWRRLVLSLLTLVHPQTFAELPSSRLHGPINPGPVSLTQASRKTTCRGPISWNTLHPPIACVVLSFADTVFCAPRGKCRIVIRA